MPTDMTAARMRVLKAIAEQDLSASAIGEVAFPESTARSAQGFALAAGRLIRSMFKDQVIMGSRSNRGYAITSKGREELAHDSE